MLGVVIIKPPKRIHIYLDGKLLIVAGFVLIVEWSRLLLNLFRGKRRSDLVGSKREGKGKQSFAYSKRRIKHRRFNMNIFQ